MGGKRTAQVVSEAFYCTRGYRTYHSFYGGRYERRGGHGVLLSSLSLHHLFPQFSDAGRANASTACPHNASILRALSASTRLSPSQTPRLHRRPGGRHFLGAYPNRIQLLPASFPLLRSVVRLAQQTCGTGDLDLLFHGHLSAWSGDRGRFSAQSGGEGFGNDSCKNYVYSRVIRLKFRREIRRCASFSSSSR